MGRGFHASLFFYQKMRILAGEVPAETEPEIPRELKPLPFYIRGFAMTIRGKEPATEEAETLLADLLAKRVEVRHTQKNLLA